jgi:hypothetical protein
MAGFQVTINGKQLAAVSNDGLNIIAVQVHGDVIGEELASVDIFGGNYGNGEADKHLIWISDYEISNNDEVEIVFVEQVSTSYPGITIEELHPDDGVQDKPRQSIEDIFEELATRPKLREKHTFELTSPDGDVILKSTSNDDYSFHFSAMWRWIKADAARISLTSNTLERIAKREDGSNHATLNLRFGQKVKLRVGS